LSTHWQVIKLETWNG